MKKINFVTFLIINAFLLINARPKKPNIVIIGAGLAGISAAVKLIENDFDNIIILEAERRLGGRIHSVPFANGIIDLGGQWIHGEKDNIVFEMMNGKYDFGATGFDDNLPEFVRSNSKEVDQMRAQEYAQLALKVLFYSNKEMSEFSGSIGDFFNKNFKFDKNDPLSFEMRDFYEKEMNIWNGSSTWFDLSARFHTYSGGNAGLQYLTWNRDGFIHFFKYLTVRNFYFYFI
jgi:monoamine oxidase